MQLTASRAKADDSRRDTVLLVEDNTAIREMLAVKIAQDCAFRTLSANSLEATRALLANRSECIFCAVLDLNLPDAPNGEVVDYVLSLGIPVMVLTGNLTEKVREQMITKPVLDYIAKQNAGEVDYVTRAVSRLYNSSKVGILVVDDARSAREYLRYLLEIQRYRVFEAEDGASALKVLDAHPSIRIVVTDYHMPGMNGMQLIAAIRQKRGRNDLAIIGLSGEGRKDLSAQLLKAGANDFLAKPFIVEEFICRINQNIDLLEQFHIIRETANRDFLTRLYNRRYLYEVGKTLLANARRGNIGLCLAVFDLDHFKSINDRYGHDGGDQVLVETARVLLQSFRETDIVARLGGEEFCVLSANLEGERAVKVFDRVRSRIERMRIQFRDQEILLTTSIGLCLQWDDDLNEMIRHADEALYEAKAQGRNRVVAH